MARILVLGAGFGGITVAYRLAALLGPEHPITVVAREANFVYLPSLPWVAVGTRQPQDIVAPLGPGLRRKGIRFVEAEVRAVDPDRRQVVVDAGVLRYDFLVIALGAELDWEALPGARTHSHNIHRLDGAVRIWEALQEFEAGEILIAIAAGADTPAPAYELAFLLDDYFRRRGRRRRIEIEIVTNEPRALDQGGDGASRVVARALEQRRIRLRTATRVRQAEPGCLVLEDGTRLGAELLFIDPPYRGPAPLHCSSLADAAGFVRCNLHMQNPDYPEVFAAGDCVALDGLKTGHNARLAGGVVAQNLAAVVGGGPPRARFRPSTLVDLPLGSRDAVFSIWKPSPPALGNWQIQITHAGRAPMWIKHALERYFLWQIGR
ncbi:NAD(P)/FAD-dependent oxidoreductase [Caldinitratiruptor microaerophilus]|uniref:Pyridine nucleotide-disulfide oxidoreductase n=1 Tax=Caldinitratiruptor microaerophilus TaxID=671077 RepID=A0AA35CR27_9FIRM|nr:FAD-dependent oxidoreductase [Caldinitratiruptor microaerophilus]BDG62396.1 pyridine nucleotide-disulfide oxidoreductase [Caldinitratiruptor microaerophilus]